MTDLTPPPLTGTPAWLAATQRSTPMWLRTLYASLPVAAVCVIHGGIHDLHPIPVGGQLRPDTTVNAIWQALGQSGFHSLLTFDPLNGLEIKKLSEGWEREAVVEALGRRTKAKLVENLLRTPAERALQAADDPAVAEVSFMGMDAIAEAVATSGVRSAGPAMALVIDYTSQVRGDSAPEDPGLRQLMLASLMLANSHATVHDQLVRFARPERDGLLRHPVIWLVDRKDDLPRWLTHGDGIRLIPISTPDVDSRQRVAELLLDGQVQPDQVGAVAKRFAEATEGLSTRGMFEAVHLARGTDSVASDIEGAVRTYREGLSENPWQSTRLREQLADGEAALQRRVKGQDDAVRRVFDILRRSSLGLTGAHQVKPSTAPRGVLYFAGPTGVGKTEMAKAVAELVFADERALLRFDMSEFHDEHAKIRLVGAPPSYVGFGAGGELTNAIQERPHSIVLFDEMDKAGREVNDLFLQILSDGRLTDGAGRTASFTDALIIFTSNQGVAAAGDLLTLEMDDPAEAALYEKTIKESVQRHFRETLGRPELLGRLGDNIVVFRPMQGRLAADLAAHFIDTTLANVRRRVGNTVALTDAAREALVAAITTREDLAYGGRGITTAIDNRLVNPLSRVLFRVAPEASLTITGAGQDDGGQPTLEVEVS